jgi:hypothetical protein
MGDITILYFLAFTIVFLGYFIGKIKEIVAVLRF